MNLGRRSLLKIGAGVGAGLAVGELVDLREVHAATKGLKLAGAKEFTTACNFCSCGCGMVCSVRDGELLQLEGDPDHVINAGALCSKGAAMKATHDSDQRVKKPMYRAPGSDKWEEISWDAALEKVAGKLKAVRDANWIATEKVGDAEVPVNRTDAIAFLGGAQNTNEECYLFKKAFTTLGTAYIEHQARL
jgi:formate dehydrogenase major subunit